MKEFHVIIPARFGSGRLPGKPLVDIAGKPMIQRVVEAAKQSHAHSITVATDDQRIFFRGAFLWRRGNYDIPRSPDRQ